jgi:hypothetical protein
MKSILNSNPLLSRSLVIIVASVIIVFSCKKTDNTVLSPNTTVSYCGTIAWSNTQGQSGIFTSSTASGSYRLTDVKFTDIGGTQGDYPLNYDSSGRLITNQSAVTYVYTQNYLSQINVDLQTGLGGGIYNFDSNGHFTSGNINFTSSDFTGTITGTYTYDSNDDPTKFSGTGTISTPKGPVNYNLQLTGVFLLDKANFLPFNPVLAPVTSYFSFIPFLSKHLLSSWTGTFVLTGAQSLTKNLNYQYTYTYDSNGNVATMVNTGNSNNTYTFTYSNCK